MNVFIKMECIGVKNEYKIGEVAEYFGISRDTLRHYDKLGILSPPQKNENGYRIYSRADFLCMSYIRDLREAGVSLKDIAVLMKDGSIEKAEAIMQIRQSQIKKEITTLEYMYGVIEDYKLCYRNIISTLNQPEIIDLPRFVYLEITDDVKVLTEATKSFKALDRNSAPRLTFLYPYNILSLSDFSSSMNNESSRDSLIKCAISIIDDKNLITRPEFDQYNFKTISEGKCLHVSIGTKFNQDYTGITKSIEYIKSQGYKVRDITLLRAVAFRNLTKQWTDYYDLWIPIE